MVIKRENQTMKKRMKPEIAMFGIAASALLLAGSSTSAVTITGTLNVSAEVVNACTVSSGNLDFSYISPKGAATAQKELSVSCDGAHGAHNSVTISMGDNAASGS
jgi:spore coat protein U-like protein